MPTCRSLALLTVALGTALTTASPAAAIVHLWDIAEIYSSEDGSVQFVELFTQAPGEVATQTGQLLSSENDVVLLGPVATPTTNRSFLLATPGFAELPGAVAPDTVMPLAPFFSVDGDILTFRALSGTVFDMATFEMGELPLDGVLSLHRIDAGGSTPAGGFFTDDNSPTNYAGDSGHVMVPEPGALLGSTLALALAGGLARRLRDGASWSRRERLR